MNLPFLFFFSRWSCD